MSAPFRPVLGPLDPGGRSQPPLIALLRLAAFECRAAPRASLPDAQAMREAATLDMVTVLARTLPALTLRRPVLWPPGTAGRSFDEDWLLALADALGQGDRPSARFLLARRARPEGAAVLRMLLSDIGDRIGET